jgi:hypothetical protein
MPLTQYPRIWLNFLCPPLRRWERAAIDAWMQETDSETREVVQSQLRLTNLAQRSVGGRVVELYYVRSGATIGKLDRRLPVGREPVTLGEVAMTVNGRRMACRLVAVDGRLFSLEFDQAPRIWTWRPRIRIDSVDTLMRPTKPTPEELQALLPADYAEVVREARSPASPTSDMSVLDLDEIYESTFVEGRFWLFAEFPDTGMLGVKTQGEDRQIYLLFYDGRRALGLGDSLKDALNRMQQLT